MKTKIQNIRIIIILPVLLALSIREFMTQIINPVFFAFSGNTVQAKNNSCILFE